jgi:DNA invertase Pin-like site-specific DNA recombinase
MHHVKPIKPVGEYARMSDDWEEQAKGVKRQIADCDTVAALRDWPVSEAHRYIDNDVSAFKRGVRRPEWERMMNDLEAGVIGGVIVYDLDRFARQPKDLERALDIFTTNPDLVFATVQGDINLMTPDGITMARVMVAFANKASMDTARRVRRKHLEQAMEGQAVGGWRSAGWAANRIDLDPFEAGLIKDAAEKVIKGASVWQIVTEWNEAGFKTVQGNPWVYSTAKATLLNERLAGFRNLRGKPLHDADGQRVRGQWKPILTPEEHRKVVEALAPQSGRNVWRSTGARGTKKYLLSGILQCGLCFGTLYGNAHKGSFTYKCPAPGASRRSCGRVNINGPETDRYVIELFRLQHINRPVESVDHAGLISAAQQRLEQASAEIAALGAQFGAGELPAEFISAALAPLQARKAEAMDELDRLRAEDLREETATYLGGKPWEDLEMEERRSLIASQFPTILIKPAKSRGANYDPGRVVPSRTKVPVYGAPTPETEGQDGPTELEPTPGPEHLTP